MRVPVISTDDVFRRCVVAGKYAPDELTNAMLRDHLAQTDCPRGFLLDGYPRTLKQVRRLDETLIGPGPLDLPQVLTVAPGARRGGCCARGSRAGAMTPSQ